MFIFAEIRIILSQNIRLLLLHPDHSRLFRFFVHIFVPVFAHYRMWLILSLPPLCVCCLSLEGGDRIRPVAVGTGGIRKVARGSLPQSIVQVLLLFLVGRGQGLGETLAEVREDLLSLELLRGGLDWNGQVLGWAEQIRVLKWGFLLSLAETFLLGSTYLEAGWFQRGLRIHTVPFERWWRYALICIGRLTHIFIEYTGGSDRHLIFLSSLLVRRLVAALGVKPLIFVQSLIPEELRRCTQLHQMLHFSVILRVIRWVHTDLVSHWVVHANTLRLKTLVFTLIVAHVVALIHVILHVILALRNIPSHQEFLRHRIAERRTGWNHLIISYRLLSVLYQIRTQWILRVIFHGQTAAVDRGRLPYKVIKQQGFLRLEEYWGGTGFVFMLRVLKGIDWILKGGEPLLLLFEGRRYQFRFVVVASLGIEALEGGGGAEVGTVRAQETIA